MKKIYKETLHFISNYFKENSICDGLIHFGSSTNSNIFKDVDLLCYFENYEPKSHYNILKSLYFLKEKFPKYNFFYHEYIIGNFMENSLNFSFVSFGKKINKYTAFCYSISKSYNCLFGINPIKNTKLPSKKECLEFMVMLHNIKKDFPLLQLKSYLRDALLAKNIYIDKKNLIEEFEKTYNTKISGSLKDFFNTNGKIITESTYVELENLYQFILKTNKFKDNQKNRKEIIGDSELIKFRIKVFDKMNFMLSKNKSKEDILNYLSKKQNEFEKLQNKK